MEADPCPDGALSEETEALATRRPARRRHWGGCVSIVEECSSATWAKQAKDWNDESPTSRSHGDSNSDSHAKVADPKIEVDAVT